VSDMNEQRSAAWLYERVGFCTASKFAAVMDITKKGTEGAKRRNYRVQLAVERLTNEPSQNFVSVAMQHGIDTEPFARMAYEARTGAVVEETGFIHHPHIELCGGSPDGLVGTDGGIEIKCPFEAAVHVETMMDRSCDEHLPQIQGLMWITGRKWWDFVSFDPRMPKGFQLYVLRVPRDDGYIAELEKSVTKFLVEVKEQHVALLAMADADRGAP
jgi:hypothetical protein